MSSIFQTQYIKLVVGVRGGRYSEIGANLVICHHKCEVYDILKNKLKLKINENQNIHTLSHHSLFSIFILKWIYFIPYQVY